MEFLTLKDIDVSYDGKTKILEKLNLDVEKGKLVSFLGPSGCGKTTTLRVIAGFISPVGGQFILEGKDYTKIPVHKRNFGMVFQSYALFPHLTVYDNIAFGLKMKKVSRAKIKESVDEIIKSVDLTGLANRYPKELSGGQRQRVALARALVVEPKLLLLDEPLSNLDAKLRVKMRVEIRQLQQKLGITTIFVTHDQEECFSISDKVAVMNKGVIEQYDSPEKIYANPATEFVARFVGFENFIDLEKIGDKRFMAKGGFLFTVDAERKKTDKESLKGTIRPEDVVISDELKGENIISGRVEVRTFLGKAYQYKVTTQMGTLTVNGANNKVYNQGDIIQLYLPPNKIILV